MAKNIIAIIDYGMGNSKSVLNMLRKIGTSSVIISNPNDLQDASKIIIPGVGSFDAAIQQLQESGFVDTLNEQVVKNKTPILGICLGMQLFAKKSEEGSLPGLGWLDAEVKKFKFSHSVKSFKIPHMGWNSVSSARQNNLLFFNVPQPMRFYFVHSYHFVCAAEENIMASTYYGLDFTCAVGKDNIYGVQFHPEKSHKFGMQVLKNFVELA